MLNHKKKIKKDKVNKKYNYLNFKQFKEKVNEYFLTDIQYYEKLSTIYSEKDNRKRKIPKLPSWDELLIYCGFKEGVFIIQKWKQSESKKKWIEFLEANRERMILRIYRFSEFSRKPSNIIMHYLDNMFFIEENNNIDSKILLELSNLEAEKIQQLQIKNEDNIQEIIVVDRETKNLDEEED